MRDAVVSTAAAAAVGPRSGKLPANPSTTLCRPQQQRQRQRAAEHAAAEGDAQALQQLLGGGLGMQTTHTFASTPPNGDTNQGASQGPHATDQQRAEEGCLSTLTLQTLLPMAQPSQLQPAQRASGWGGGQPPQQQVGAPSSPAAGGSHGLAAEPSALTAYIMSLEESSSMVQRQLTHLQASTSSAGPGGSGPAPFRSARHAPGRREVFVLSKWLEVETQRFNATYSRKDERTPLVDFLMLAAAKGKAIYSQAYAELARQVTQHCEERGRLMADVWIGYGAMIDSVLCRVHAAYAVVKDRAERAEVRLEMAEAQLEHERESSDAYKTELQDELARLRAELTAALSMGGGGGHVDVMSMVLGPRGGTAGGTAADGSRPSKSGAGRDSSRVPGRSVRFRDSSANVLARGSTAAGKRGTMAFEAARNGSHTASISMRLHDPTMVGFSSDESDALQQQNAALKEALDASREELFEVYKQMAELESAANEVVQLESRAEAAENERDEAVSQLRSTTPRPQRTWDELQALVGDQGIIRFQAALDAHKHWPTDDLAAMLAGSLLHHASSATEHAGSVPAGEGGSAAGGGQQEGGEAATSAASGAVSGACEESHLRDHVELGLGCLRVAVSQGQLSREDIKKAVQACNATPLIDAADEEHASWLAQAVSRPAANVESLIDFLAGATRQGLPLSPSFYGCMEQYHKGITFDQVRSAVQRARMSSKTRVVLLEDEARALQKEAVELREIVRGYREAEQRRDAARRRREEEAQLEKKNPLQQYVELLGSQDEAAWKEWLIGMGQSADVPKIFKHSGKIRNKHISKRDTEKLVKEIWKERMADPAAAAGKACDLLEFVFQQLQKKVGIVTAVVEAGYNFLFGLWKYQWDADCELFLRILMGEVKEDVYVAQIKLQEELEALFAAIDKAKGQATGFIDKDDLRTAFLAYFKVGQANGKTLKRFDELMQAMDEDQEGDTVEWMKVFEEDREFNQGEFAESIRDQFLQERVEFFAALEAAIYDEAGHEEECSKEHLVRALLHIDLDMSDKVAQQTAGAIFGGDIDVLSVKVVMRKLSRGVVRRSRASSSKMSLSGAAALKAKSKKGVLGEASLRALEALRQDWIAREVQKNHPALPKGE